MPGCTISPYKFVWDYLDRGGPTTGEGTSCNNCNSRVVDGTSSVNTRTLSAEIDHTLECDTTAAPFFIFMPPFASAALDQEFIIRILSHKAVTINGNGVNIDDLPAHVLSGATYKEVTIFKTSRLVWGIR